jgi:hypothetical protein
MTSDEKRGRLFGGRVEAAVLECVRKTGISNSKRTSHQRPDQLDQPLAASGLVGRGGNCLAANPRSDGIRAHVQDCKGQARQDLCNAVLMV